MGRAAKEKGSAFERLVCQRLSLWVSNQTRKDIFWRSSMSGGRATLRGKGKWFHKHAQAGDVCAVHPLGHAFLELFFVECKRYHHFHTHRMVYGTGGGPKADDLWDHWTRTRIEAQRVGRSPFLVAKEDLQIEILGTDLQGLSLLDEGCLEGVLRPQSTFPRLGLYVLPFAEVLAGVDFDVIRENYEGKDNPDRPRVRCR